MTIEKSAEAFEGAIIVKPPKVARAIARNASQELRLIKIGRKCIVSPHAVIYTDTEIGEGMLSCDNASISEQSSIVKNFIISRNVTVNYNTTIGNFSKIMDNQYLSNVPTPIMR